MSIVNYDIGDTVLVHSKEQPYHKYTQFMILVITREYSNHVYKMKSAGPYDIYVSKTDIIMKVEKGSTLNEIISQYPEIFL